MDKEPPTIPSSMRISQLSQLIALGDSSVSQRQGTLILDAENRLSGIITRGDVVRALQKDPRVEMKVMEAGNTRLVVAHPDELLHDALAKMLRHNIGRLPVVERERPDHVIGYLGRSSILAARLRHFQEEEVRERGEVLRSFALRANQR